MIDREVAESGILDEVEGSGSGFVSFSPLAQGLLTDRYINGVREGSRMSLGRSLKPSQLTDEYFRQVKALSDLAMSRGQNLAEMALGWVLNDKRVTSVIVGCSSVIQLGETVKAVDSPKFTAEELKIIDSIIFPERKTL